MWSISTQRTWCTLAAAAGIAVGGCGRDVHPSATGIDRDTRVVLNALAECYAEYMQYNRGRPPKDAESFRKFLDTRDSTLELYGIENVDALLKSPRDGEPFVILYGKTIPIRDSGGAEYVAFEQTGVDEFRMAARSRGGVDLLDPEEFQNLIGSQL